MKGIQEVLLPSRGINSADIGPVDDKGFAPIKRMSVISVSDNKQEIKVNDEGKLIVNGEMITDGVIVEAMPIDGTYTNTKGLRFRITAYEKGTKDSNRLRITSQVYFRNME